MNLDDLPPLASYRWSSSSLSSLSSNFSVADPQSQWKTLQMADINDDDHHFKRRISGPSTCLLEDTEATDGDIDSPVSKIRKFFVVMLTSSRFCFQFVNIL